MSDTTINGAQAATEITPPANGNPADLPLHLPTERELESNPDAWQGILEGMTPDEQRIAEAVGNLFPDPDSQDPENVDTSANVHDDRTPEQIAADDVSATGASATGASADTGGGAAPVAGDQTTPPSPPSPDTTASIHVPAPVTPDTEFIPVQIGEYTFRTPEELTAAENALRWLNQQDPQQLQAYLAQQQVPTPPTQYPAQYPAQTPTPTPIGLHIDPHIEQQIVALEAVEPELGAMFRAQQEQLLQTQTYIEQQQQEQYNRAVAERNEIANRVSSEIQTQYAFDAVVMDRVTTAAARNGMIPTLMSNGASFEQAARQALEAAVWSDPQYRAQAIAAQAQQITQPQVQAQVQEVADVLQQNDERKRRAAGANSAASAPAAPAPIDPRTMTPQQRQDAIAADLRASRG